MFTRIATIAAIFIFSQIKCRNREEAEIKFDTDVEQKVNIGFIPKEMEPKPMCRVGVEDWCPVITEGSPNVTLKAFPGFEANIRFRSGNGLSYDIIIRRNISPPRSTAKFICAKGKPVSQVINAGFPPPAAHMTKCTDVDKTDVYCEHTAGSNFIAFRGICKEQMKSFQINDSFGTVFITVYFVPVVIDFPATFPTTTSTTTTTTSTTVTPKTNTAVTAQEKLSTSGGNDTSTTSNGVTCLASLTVISAFIFIL